MINYIDSKKYSFIEYLSLTSKVVVLKVKSTSNGKFYVYKIVKENFLNKNNNFENFDNILNILSKIDSNKFHTVKIIDYFEKDGHLVIVQEFVNGSSLFDIIKEEKEISIKQIIDIIEKLSNTIGFLFSKKVKLRSIKLSNIFVSENSLKILWFETPKNRNYTITSDIYFLGTLFYQLINRKFIEFNESNFEIAKKYSEIILNEESLKIDKKNIDQIKRTIYKSTTKNRDSFKTIDDFIKSIKKLKNSIKLDKLLKNENKEVEQIENNIKDNDIYKPSANDNIIQKSVINTNKSNILNNKKIEEKLDNKLDSVLVKEEREENLNFWGEKIDLNENELNDDSFLFNISPIIYFIIGISIIIFIFYKIL